MEKNPLPSFLFNNGGRFVHNVRLCSCSTSNNTFHTSTFTGKHALMTSIIACMQYHVRNEFAKYSGREKYKCRKIPTKNAYVKMCKTVEHYFFPHSWNRKQKKYFSSEIHFHSRQVCILSLCIFLQ